MNDPGRKVLVVVACALLFALTWMGRAWILERQPQLPTPPLLTDERRVPAETIIIHYHHRPPFYLEDGGQVRGLVIDPISRAFKEAGIPHLWRETPAKRQLELIAAGEDLSCGAGWFKTPEREVYARYTLPVYRDKPTVAVFRASDDYLPDGPISLDQVLGEWRLTLLAKEGYSYGPYIDGHLQALSPRRIFTTGENRDILRMIEQYRADYSFLSEEEAAELLSDSGFVADRFKIVRFRDVPEGGDRHIMCSKKVSEETMTRLDAAIRRLQPAGEGK
jgi:polar amino acid transport system substrate-binding protein